MTTGVLGKVVSAHSRKKLNRLAATGQISEVQYWLPHRHFGVRMGPKRINAFKSRYSVNIAFLRPTDYLKAELFSMGRAARILIR